ncbi:hypothetical protein BRC81_01560 [Halobacteriales archaeon QS_1_68_20]|nr:MAG: hypothetical protein BRC81_01560 [Halobacteriales archaeon QS_1_68_20]
MVSVPEFHYRDATLTLPIVTVNGSEKIDGRATIESDGPTERVDDALAGSGVEGLSESNRGKIDYETMLEVDPDVLFVRGQERKTRQEFEDTVLAFMREKEVASELTAVQNGDVYRGGPIYQGPIHNLFLIERFATLLYPDRFSGELFDRQAVADVIAGDG